MKMPSLSPALNTFCLKLPAQEFPNLPNQQDARGDKAMVLLVLVLVVKGEVQEADMGGGRSFTGCRIQRGACHLIPIPVTKLKSYFLSPTQDKKGPKDCKYLLQMRSLNESFNFLVSKVLS